MPQYGISLLQRLLQQGRHVADVGVLYPIATLQAGYRFGVGKPYEGGVIPPEADYMDVGEMLALGVRRDYTFLHPEVLDDRSTVDGPTLRLENETNHEQYRVLLIPGSRAIHLSNLKKIRQFYDQGGRVIATTRLPDASAERGKNAEVQSIVASIFGTELSAAADGYVVRAGANGGKAYFIPRPTPSVLQAVLDDALGVYDVEIEDAPRVSGGNLSYIHKVIRGRDVYFFANSSDLSVDTHVRLRGKLRLERWDPHTGDIRPWPSTHLVDSSTDVTRAKLTLPPVTSLFLVATGPPGDA